MTACTPIPDFYVLGGTLPRDARSYAVRKADEELMDGLRKGQFCYVLTSRQMGKSSLMVRTVTRLRQENITCLVIDLTAAGQNLTEDQWYDGLLNRVAVDLNLEDELEAFWQEHQRIGPLQRWMLALRSVVLARISGQVVIFVDEVDAVRSLPFSADEFFAAIRECYNRRTKDPEFQRMSFCLLGVATPADLIRDTRSTPFNIGRRIMLTDFSEAEAAALADGLVAIGKGGLGSEGEEEKALLNRVLYWTHGHPYLTQRLCSAVSDNLSSPTPNQRTTDRVDRICSEVFLSPGAQIQDDNLLFVRERLLRADSDLTQLLALYARIRAGKRVENSESDHQIGILRLSGIVRVENGVLCVRNQIYSHVFDREWVRRNTPNEDLKRQRTAFRKGILGTALAAAALLLTVIGGFMLTHYQKHLNMHVPLPDGTQLIVTDVTFGKEAVYEPSMFRWSTLFGRRSSTIVFREPTLSVWACKYNPTTGISGVITYNPQIIAIDDHGDQFVPSTIAVMADPKVMRFDFTNFPRRSKTIHLRLYAAAGLAGVGRLEKEFDVPNPAPTLYPLWTPEPLPATRTVNDLNVRLNSVRWLQNGKTSVANGSAPVQNHQFWPDYSCSNTGTLNQTLDSSWQIESMELSDATGNKSDARSTAGRLCFYEPAWRLSMSLVRSVDSTFSAAETWTVKAAKMPADGKSTLIAETGKLNGITFKKISIVSAPGVTYSDVLPPAPIGALGKKWGMPDKFGYAMNIQSGGNMVTGSAPQIAVRAEGIRQDQKLIVWATDVKGIRYNQFSDTLYYPGNSAEDTSLQLRLLPIPARVGNVDVHFSVQDIQTVDFMVRPPLPAEGASN